MKKTVILLTMLISFALMAEMKFAYINSDKVIAEYNEAKKVKEELAEWNKEKESEAMQMEKEIQNLEEEIKNMSMMVSEEKRNEKMAEGQSKLQQYYEFKEVVWGQNGEFYKKNSQLMQPVIDQINDVIKEISQADGYDFVFDANTGTLLHAKPEYEITDRVLKELNK
ncbi:MAG: OmpH family outer membrane protein [Candidatus Delongbacteria bacterium]